MFCFVIYQDMHIRNNAFSKPTVNKSDLFALNSQHISIGAWHIDLPL